MGKRKEPAIHVEVTVRSRGGSTHAIARVNVDIVKKTAQKRFVARLREAADHIEKVLELKTAARAAPRRPRKARVYASSGVVN